jgi:hypothetical protein
MNDNTSSLLSIEKKAVSPLELFYLFKKLSLRQDIGVHVKKHDAQGLGNSASVLRASNSLIMLKDNMTGEVEFFSELRAIDEFQLDKDCTPYRANVTYPVR